MKDHITIGSTPSNEGCFGVGHPLSRAETAIYRDQLRREFPTADLRIKGFPHDFGVYYEVCAFYDDDDDDEDSINLAYAVEADAAPEWDDIARKELKALKATAP